MHGSRDCAKGIALLLNFVSSSCTGRPDDLTFRHAYTVKVTRGNAFVNLFQFLLCFRYSVSRKKCSNVNSGFPPSFNFFITSLEKCGNQVLAFWWTADGKQHHCQMYRSYRSLIEIKPLSKQGFNCFNLFYISLWAPL